jgi:sec-independent protein translocase protein TatC
MADKNKTMPFWSHVYEIRNRLLIVSIFILIFSIGGYLFFPEVYSVIQKTIGEKLYATNIAEGFVTRLRTSILLGVFFSIPALLFEIVLFLFPALNKKSKFYLLAVLISSFILFILGIVFAYKTVLPISINFLTSETFFPDTLRRLISYNAFTLFFIQFLIGFGTCFQFPLVLLFLMKTGVLKLSFLVKNFKYAIVIVLIISAVITPPDIVSQLLLSLPMMILYALCILIGKIFRLGGD